MGKWNYRWNQHSPSRIPTEDPRPSQERIGNLDVMPPRVGQYLFFEHRTKPPFLKPLSLGLCHRRRTDSKFSTTRLGTTCSNILKLYYSFQRLSSAFPFQTPQNQVQHLAPNPESRLGTAVKVGLAFSSVQAILSSSSCIHLGSSMLHLAAATVFVGLK